MTLRRAPAFILIAALLAACGSAQQPAARVSGSEISNAELEHEIKLDTFLSSVTGRPCGTPVPGERSDAACARFALTNLIEQFFVDRYAAGHGITVTSDRVQTTLAAVQSRLGADTLQRALSTSGLAKEDLSRLGGQLLEFTDVETAVVASRVGDAALQAQYQQHILDFTNIDAEHVLVKTKLEAERVYRLATAPGATEQTFMDLARKYSTDTASAQNGGDLGTAAASTYALGFATAAVELSPGEVSDPVQTQFGWHVIRLVSEAVTPFEQAKTQLVQQVPGQTFGDWLREQVSSSGLDVNPRYGRWDDRTLSVVAIRSTATGAPAVSASPTP